MAAVLSVLQFLLRILGFWNKIVSTLLLILWFLEGLTNRITSNLVVDIMVSRILKTKIQQNMALDLTLFSFVIIILSDMAANLKVSRVY